MLYKNKYRTTSIRLQNWDYRWAAAYFITLNTKNRVHYFGEIQDQKMNLSCVGVIADLLWYQIPYHSKNIELGAFVVMPDHIHGIIIIKKSPEMEKSDVEVEEGQNTAVEEGKNTAVEEGHALPRLQSESLPRLLLGKDRFQNIGKNSLSSIVGSYKSAVTKHARRLGYELEWQSLFYEHIIRGDYYHRIAQYILDNPKNWGKKKSKKNR